MRCQTRSTGAAQDPELGPEDFVILPQPGAKKAKVIATRLPTSASNNGFLTLKVPTNRFRALSLSSGSVASSIPPAASAFVSLRSPPPTKDQEGVNREDSIADSAVDLRTPAPDPAPLSTVDGQSSIATLRESDPARRNSLGHSPISPITPPRPQVPFAVPQPSGHHHSATGAASVEGTVTQSSENHSIVVTSQTNDQVAQSADATSFLETSRYSSQDLTPALNPEQDHYSLEPSPKSQARDLRPQISTAGTSTRLGTDSDQTELLLASFSSEGYRARAQQSSAVLSTPQSPAASFETVTDTATEKHYSNPKKPSPSKRNRSVTSASREEEATPKRRPGRPWQEERKPSLIARLPVPKGYVLTKDMAPVRDPKDVGGNMKEIIQNMFDVTQTVHGFVPEAQELLINRMEELSQNLARLENNTNQNTSPNNPVHDIRIAPEIVDYVDDSRNPDIFTRDFMEVVQRGNAVMNGKKQAFNSFAQIFAKELKNGIGGVDKQVDAVMKNAGLELKDEDSAEVQTQENGEKSG